MDLEILTILADLEVRANETLVPLSLNGSHSAHPAFSAPVESVDFGGGFVQGLLFFSDFLELLLNQSHFLEEVLVVVHDAVKVLFPHQALHFERKLGRLEVFHSRQVVLQDLVVVSRFCQFPLQFLDEFGLLCEFPSEVLIHHVQFVIVLFEVFEHVYDLTGLLALALLLLLHFLLEGSFTLEDLVIGLLEELGQFFILLLQLTNLLLFFLLFQSSFLLSGFDLGRARRSIARNGIGILIRLDLRFLFGLSGILYLHHRFLHLFLSRFPFLFFCLTLVVEFKS